MNIIRKLTILVVILGLISTVSCTPVEVTIVVLTATSSPPPTIQPQPQLQPTETQVSIPTLTPFVPREVIKIVSQAPLFGNQAEFGQDIMRGAQLAVQQLSGPLNELSYGVELVTYDDQN